MRETHRPGSQRYIPDDQWKECDYCGFDYLQSQLIQNWEGFWQCPKCYDENPIVPGSSTISNATSITVTQYLAVDCNLAPELCGLIVMEGSRAGETEEFIEVE